MGPNFTSSSNTVTAQGSIVKLNNLSSNTNYSIAIAREISNPVRICGIGTLPQQFAQYGNSISFYEGPLKHRLPPDTSVYYSRNDRNTTLQQAINLVQQVRTLGAVIDTMWFHASVVPKLDGIQFTPPAVELPPTPQVCGFTVKLRQKDDRMLSLGFANRVGFWEYADNLTFYRYVFSGTTSVQISSFALNSPLGVAPNPSNGEQTTLYYTLPQSSETSVVVVNLLGQRVFEEYLGFQHEGSHTIPLNIGHLPNGMYRVCLSITKNNAAYTVATQALTIVK